MYNRVGFFCICTFISRQCTPFFYRRFTGATESGMSMGGCNFGNTLHVNAPKCHGRNVFVSCLKKTLQLVRILLSGNRSLFFLLRILLKPWTLSFNKDRTTAKSLSQLKCLADLKKLRFTLHIRDPVLHSSFWTWDTFSAVILSRNSE